MFKSRSPRLTDGQRMLGLAGIGVGGARPAVRWSPRRKFVGYVAVRSEAANYDANFGGGGGGGGGGRRAVRRTLSQRCPQLSAPEICEIGGGIDGAFSPWRGVGRRRVGIDRLGV